MPFNRVYGDYKNNKVRSKKNFVRHTLFISELISEFIFGYGIIYADEAANKSSSARITVKNMLKIDKFVFTFVFIRFICYYIYRI